MRKTLFIMVVILLSWTSLVFADGHNFAEIKQVIDSGIGCDELSSEQLEAIGDYYMEQMHPGEAHKIMDNMMGGEGSASLKHVHINMAKKLYCNDNLYTGYGMMGVMNMMGSGGMMGSYPAYYSYDYNSFWNIVWLIFLIGIIVLIIWLIYKLTRKREESETPISILQKRFAKGEITKKEFDDMKKEIGE